MPTDQVGGVGAIPIFRYNNLMEIENEKKHIDREKP